MRSERLKGKIAAVTGIGNGIGKGCALVMARQGAKVVGCDIDAAAAAATVAEAEAEGLDFTSVHPCDLTSPDDVRRYIDRAAEAGGIDILVNAAATRPQLERPEFGAAVRDKMMLDRLGQPEDVAWAAVYLASDEASFVTGADLSVDRGATAW